MLLAGLWAGALLAISAIAAPAAFYAALPEVAGRVAGRMFLLEARIGLAIAVILVVLLRSHAKLLASSGPQSVFSTNLMLVLGAIFCTVAGFFALQPMMADARAGQGPLSFGTLHGLSVAFYAIKTLLVLALAWRLAAR